MLAKIAKTVSDIIYLVPFAMSNFRKKYPQETIHAFGAAKGLRSDDEAQISGVGWGFARRGTLILSNERLKQGNWTIPLAKVKYAEAIHFGAQGLILKIADADGNHYQFGVQYDPSWLEQSVLPIKVTDEPIKYASSILAFRKIFYVGFVLWFLYTIGDTFLF